MKKKKLKKKLTNYAEQAKGLTSQKSFFKQPTKLALSLIASTLPILPVAVNGQCMGNTPAVAHNLGTGGSVSIDVDGGGADFKFRLGMSYYGNNTGLYMTILNGTIGTVNGGSVFNVPNGAAISVNGGYFGVNGTPAASMKDDTFAGVFRLVAFGSGNIPIRIGGTLGFINLSVSGGSPPNIVTIGEFGLDSNGGTVTAGDCASLGVLPVELVYFSAVNKGNSAHLAWQTASEVNNAGFEIERSEDGKNFHSISWAEGHGTTVEEQSYLFDDKNLRSGHTYYYRLKQVDFDGKFDYSKIVSATLKGGEDVISEFYPNPVSTGFASIEINSKTRGEWTTDIFDMSGKVIRTEKRLLEGENAVLKFDMTGLSQGIYFVKFENGSKQYYRKLIVE